MTENVVERLEALEKAVLRLEYKCLRTGQHVANEHGPGLVQEKPGPEFSRAEAYPDSLERIKALEDQLRLASSNATIEHSRYQESIDESQTRIVKLEAYVRRADMEIRLKSEYIKGVRSFLGQLQRTFGNVIEHVNLSPIYKMPEDGT